MCIQVRLTVGGHGLEPSDRKALVEELSVGDCFHC